MTIESDEQNRLTREVVQLDEIVSCAQELLNRYREKNVEYVEAQRRYDAILPLGQALEPGEDIEPHFVDWEEAERRLQILEQKIRERQEAQREFWEFREQHRDHLRMKGFLK